MAIALKPSTIYYPDSDGEPMADNTLQFRWIVTIQGNIAALYANDADVFVAGDLLWYPVEGDNRTRMAPDTMVAFGRPKGERGSYRQWEENGIAPQIVFEVLSPGNRFGEMLRKRDFYERYGVDEYYIYNPDTFAFEIFLRENGSLLQMTPDSTEFISPRMGVRFRFVENEPLQIFYPNSEPFLTFQEIAEQREAEKVARIAAEKERAQAERERSLAEQERDSAERERDAERERAERLAARLRELGINPDA
jgi:Uma2 family endonuclease